MKTAITLTNARKFYSSLATSLILASAMNAFSFQSSFASTMLTAAEMTRISQLEQSFYGRSKERLELSGPERLSSLETSIFGESKSADEPTAKRLESIASALGQKDKDSYLLPPLAGRFDHTNSGSDSAIGGGIGSGSGIGNSIGSSGISRETPARTMSESPAPARTVSREDQYLQNAMSRYAAGDMVAAEEGFRKVLSVNNKNIDAHYNLGVIAESRGDKEAALKSFEAAYNLDRNDSELAQTVNSLKAAVASERQKKIAQSAEIEKARQKERLSAVVADASADYKAGRFNQAVNKLEKVAAEAPSDPDVQYALGQAYRASGDSNRAKIAFDRAIKIDPANSLYRDAAGELSGTIARGGRGNNDRRDNSEQMASSSPGQITPFSDSASDGYGNGTRTYGAEGSFNQRFLGSRLKRTIAGGAAGAVAGAAWGVSTRNGVKSSAMQGALLGGLMGYMSGR